MKKTTKNLVSASVAAVMMGGASLAHAADSVNVAFFLEWATPNQIAKVDKTYDDAMGVDVKWTNFSTGVETTALARTQIIAQASTAMLAQANQVKQTVLALLQ